MAFRQWQARWQRHSVVHHAGGAESGAKMILIGAQKQLQGGNARGNATPREVFPSSDNLKPVESLKKVRPHLNTARWNCKSARELSTPIVGRRSMPPASNRHRHRRDQA